MSRKNTLYKKGVYTFFLILVQNSDCGYSLMRFQRGPKIYVAKNKDNNSRKFGGTVGVRGGGGGRGLGRGVRCVQGMDHHFYDDLPF